MFLYYFQPITVHSKDVDISGILMQQRAHTALFDHGDLNHVV